MRTLLTRLRLARRHVLLSSHLLHEVQATADHLVVISKGTVVASVGGRAVPRSHCSCAARPRGLALHFALPTSIYTTNGRDLHVDGSNGRSTPETGGHRPCPQCSQRAAPFDAASRSCSLLTAAAEDHTWKCRS